MLPRTLWINYNAIAWTRAHHQHCAWIWERAGERARARTSRGYFVCKTARKILKIIIINWSIIRYDAPFIFAFVHYFSSLNLFDVFFHQFHIRTLDFQVRVKIARFPFLMQSYVEIHDLFSKLISILLASQKLHELILIQFSTGIFLSSYLWILYRCAASQVCMALYSFDLLFKRINDWSRLFSFASSVCVCVAFVYC